MKKFELKEKFTQRKLDNVVMYLFQISIRFQNSIKNIKLHFLFYFIIRHE